MKLPSLSFSHSSGFLLNDDNAHEYEIEFVSDHLPNSPSSDASSLSPSSKFSSLRPVRRQEDSVDHSSLSNAFGEKLKGGGGLGSFGRGSSPKGSGGFGSSTKPKPKSKPQTGNSPKGSSPKSSGGSGHFSSSRGHHVDKPRYNNGKPGQRAMNTYLGSGLTYFGSAYVLDHAIRNNQFYSLSVNTQLINNTQVSLLSEKSILDVPSNMSFAFNSSSVLVLNDYYKKSDLDNVVTGYFYRIAPTDNCNDTASLQASPSRTIYWDDVSDLQSFGLIALAPFDKCAPNYAHRAMSDNADAILFYNASTYADSETNFDSFTRKISGSFLSNLPMLLISHSYGLRFEDALTFYSAPNIQLLPDNGMLVHKYGDINAKARLGTPVYRGQGTFKTLSWFYILIAIIAGIFLIVSVYIILHFTGILSGFYRTLRRAGAPIPQRFTTTRKKSKSSPVKKELLETFPVRLYTVSEPTLPSATYQTTNDSALSLSGSENSKNDPALNEVRPVNHYDQNECTICLCDYSDDHKLYRELPCLHIYHPDCIDPYLLNISDKCPVCKQSVLPPSIEKMI
ncbi:ubiquitin-protein ligase E3 [Schizosaccharomyces octosporus yFS286]|uniref:RING-type E3 ubiquitin transferase n=1 Tax=Schizosaccharomyces octosporus (strain yFS286) TaxID=483514 RepID=S9RMJ1_SCHOY|nr:ubiquitin-protein ligase E3 [Schizosaccharomyces octosporus yFS286]EPX75139.1 ubiquitin-protein ligase E3 [Schizosaccharomyces octosporus yFS286]